MPAAAVSDMREWVDAPPEQFFEFMLANEYEVESLLIDRRRAATLAISDDRPVNESYLLRHGAGTDVAAPTLERMAPPSSTVPW